MNTRSAKAVTFKPVIAPGDETRSLYHYLGIVRNRRWFLAGAVSTSLLLALLGSFVFTYEYRASSTVQINPERSNFYDGWRQTGTKAEYRTHYLTELEGLTSNGLARRVIDDLQLWQHDEFSPAWKRALGIVQSESGVIESFRQRVRVSTLNDSMLINVQFSASDPKLASSVLNALVNRFTSEHSESKRQLPGLAADWMSEKIPALKTSLAEAEKEMDAYRREHGLVDVEGSISRLNELELTQTSLTVSQMSLEIEQIRTALAEAMSIFEDMSDPTETGERLESLEMVSSDPIVQEAWMRRSTILNHIQTLSIKYGPKHPSMIDANTQLASVDAEIAEQIDRIITTAIKRVESLTRQLSTSQSQVADKKQEVMSTQEKRFKLNALEREVAMQRQLVDKFYVDTIEARSLEGFELASSVIVDAAVTPLQPYRPQRAIVLMLVALSSSIFALLFVFVHEHVDDKIRSTKDVGARLRVNLLGILPEFNSIDFAVKPGKSREPAYMYQHSQVVAEAVNNIRTSLITHRSKRVSDASVLLVTASQSGEGTTTAAIALAHSFARLERVLLIDCHLRQATSSEESDTVVGLNALITGTTSIENSVRRNALGGNFDVLVCAPDAANSTAILASSQFTQLLDQLREQYDRIILDTAPLQRDASSIALGRLADAIVYVVRSHSTRLMAILRGIRRLRAADGCVAGVMINRIDLNRVVSYGGDYDYASYCGDISYKEKTDVDIARDALNAFADRVSKAYREIDVTGKWKKTRSMVMMFSQRVPAMQGAIRNVDMAGISQYLVTFKNSAINIAGNAVNRCSKVDLTRMRERAEQYRSTIVANSKRLGGATITMAAEKLEPCYERTSKTVNLASERAALLVKRVSLPSSQLSDELSDELSADQESAADSTSSLMSYYLPGDFQIKADRSFASDRPRLNKNAVAET